MQTNRLATDGAVIAPHQARTQRILESLRFDWKLTEINHGAHQTNLRLLAWLVGSVAQQLFDHHPLRDNLKLIAVTAMRWLPWSWEMCCDQILAERQRQQDLLAAGKFDFNCASAHIENLFKLPVLMEEAGEVAEAVLEKQTSELATELVQVATVCVAWLEALEAQKE